MSLNGKHILVLEDEPIIAFALEDMLIEEGATVSVFSSIEQAREGRANETFDYAILDVNLHGSKSYPLAYELKADDIPFAFATGYGDAEHPKELVNSVTITKPYSIVQIRAAIESLESASDQ